MFVTQHPGPQHKRWLLRERAASSSLRSHIDGLGQKRHQVGPGGSPGGSRWVQVGPGGSPGGSRWAQVDLQVGPGETLLFPSN